MIVKKHYLITGGKGLIGSYLTKELLMRGYLVAHLSRSKYLHDKVPTYAWDVERKFIEEGAIENAECIIHLAGESISKGKWSDKQKQEIINSRIKTTGLLQSKLKSSKNHVNTFICASAIGFYGNVPGDELVYEESEPGKDFLSEVTLQWEEAARKIEKEQHLRTVIVRLGSVLSLEGGFLNTMVKMVKSYKGATLGSGNQYISWIHIKDACDILIKAIEDQNMKGVYNAVAPNPVKNARFTELLGKFLHRPILLPNAPSFILKAILGEKAIIALNGCKASARKIQNQGYNFQYKTIETALGDILNVKK